MGMLQNRINEIIDVYNYIQASMEIEEDERLKENLDEDKKEVEKRRKAEEHLSQISEAFLNQQEDELITNNIEEVREKIQQVMILSRLRAH